MIIAGIDPGITGGIAAISPTGECASILMPVIDEVVDGRAILRFLNDHDVDFIVIEKVHAMPGQGVTSMFNFGHSAGAVRTIGQLIHQWPEQPRMVTPQSWKKHFGLIKSDKNASREYAGKLFPRAVDQFKRVKDHGRADAALIGAFHLGMKIT